MHIIIPARYASTRFPAKALALLQDKALVVHVLHRAQEAHLGPVYVATDDQRIAAVVEQAGGQTIMTRPDHHSGTDRIAEAVQNIPDIDDDEVIINVQGDEPLIEVETLRLLAARFNEPNVKMATVAAPLEPGLAHSPHIVKVVVDASGRALYFSRSVLPWSDHQPAPALRRHLGLYAYRRRELLQFASWPASPYEEAERLEQLRALHHGLAIYVVDVKHAWGGVDTPEDLAALEARLRGKT